MSGWTKFRDGLEAAFAIVINYWYPGLGAIIGPFTSQGAQEHLYGNWMGQAAMIGSGMIGAGVGNMANYGSTLDWLAGGAGAGSVGADAGGTLVGGDLAKAAQAKTLIDSGMPAIEAYQSVGIAPGEMGAMSSTGAAPAFSGQEVEGAYGNISSSAFDAGTAPGSFNAAGAAPAAGHSLGGNAAAPGAMAAASSTGALPWSSPGNLANIAQGISGLMSANRMGNYAEMADPFAQYRKQYGERLARLEADPTAIQREPGYEAGLQAVQRSMAAQGYTGSGNMMAAIAKYGGDFYNQTANRYAQLAGAGVNPASAAQLGMTQQMYQDQLRRASIGNFGYAGTMAGGWPRG